MTQLLLPAARRRTVVGLVATAVLLGGALSASAAPHKAKAKLSCDLVSEHDSDAPGTPSLDITSADVATNATTLTAVMRVVNLAGPDDPTVTLGRQWQMSFYVDGRRILVTVNSGPAGDYDGSGNGADIKLDTARNEISWTMSLANIAKTSLVTVTPGRTKFTDFLVVTASGVALTDTGRAMAGLGFQSYGDVDQAANSTAVYIAGAPSCVKVAG